MGLHDLLGPMALRSICFRSLVEVPRAFHSTNRHSFVYKYLQIDQRLYTAVYVLIYSFTRPILGFQGYTLSIRSQLTGWRSADAVTRQSHAIRSRIFPIQVDHLFNMQKESRVLVCRLKVRKITQQALLWNLLSVGG